MLLSEGGRGRCILPVDRAVRTAGGRRLIGMQYRIRPLTGFWLALLYAGVTAAHAAAPADPPVACQSRSAAQQALLLELYTSEGCSSCPPADRWFSSLRHQNTQVLAAAFHVDYWDRLGWVDRFGSAAHSARQAAQVRRGGARFAYTPQVLANGRDWRGWPALPLPGADARVQVQLQRQGAQAVQAAVTPLPGAPTRLALWWALLEHGHSSQVAAGENQGVLLHHDHVVRRYQALPAWTASAGVAQRFSLPASARGEGDRAARLLVVVTDGDDGPPLQALALDC